MSTRTWTLIFMAVVIVAIAVYDTIVAINGIPGDTISEITLAWGRRHPIAVLCLGLALGIVLGHLFWPQTVYVEVPVPATKAALWTWEVRQ